MSAKPLLPPKLIVERPDQAPGEIVFVKRTILAGRVKTNDIVLSGDGAASREHCRFDYDPETQRATVRDEGSANGTFLNGKPLGSDSVELKDGDCIQIGETKLLFLAKPREEGGRVLRHIGQKVFGAPLPPEPGEETRTIFIDERALCGRCGAVLDLRGVRPGAKIGCARCRAVFKIQKKKHADSSR